MTPEELKAIEERCVELRKGGLIDTEMVIQLSRLIGDTGGLLDYIKDLERAHEILSDGYDQMKAHLESKIPRWIPATERLPEEWEYVLLEVPENPPHYKVVGYRIGSLFRDHTHQVVKEVSNWMPLLKGQKEKEVDTMPVKVKKWEWSMGIFPSVLQATRHLTEEEAENYRQTHEYAWKHKITETEMEEEVMNRRIGDEW